MAANEKMQDNRPSSGSTGEPAGVTVAVGALIGVLVRAGWTDAEVIEAVKAAIAVSRAMMI